MTLSLWQQHAHAPDRHDTAVAIIGAGITGLSAAIECESRDIPCVVIEADTPASKASGRNAGYLMRGAAENYATAIDELGPDRARFLWRWTERNLDHLRDLGVASLPGFTETPSCLAATEEDEAEQLERSATLLAEDGFEAELIRPQDNSAPRDPVWNSGHATLGLVNTGDAACSPVELVHLLQRTLDDTPVLTNAPVYDIEAGDQGVTIHARGHTVHADHALVCTNAYASQLLPEFAGVVHPNRGQMLAFRPEDPALAALAYAYYLNHGSEYIRPGPDNTVILGGARMHDEINERTDTDAVTSTIQDRLEYWARTLVTDRYEITARWSGIMGFTDDAMPIVRPTSLDPRVWFCGGLTGHGMSMGHITARHAVAAMLDAVVNPFDLLTNGARPVM